MRGLHVVLVALLAACGNDETAGIDAADVDPIPADAIWLDPASGSATNPGTADAPWPGLADAIAADLLDTVADGATLVLRDGNHGNAVFEGNHTVAVTIRAAWKTRRNRWRWSA